MQSLSTSQLVSTFLTVSESSVELLVGDLPYGQDEYRRMDIYFSIDIPHNLKCSRTASAVVVYFKFPDTQAHGISVTKVDQDVDMRTHEQNEPLILHTRF